MKACAECLGSGDLRIIKAGLNVKTSEVAVRGGVMAGPQMLAPQETHSGEVLLAGEEPHMQEYGNTTLAAPSSDTAEAVVAVIFLNDIKDTGGALCIVPHTAGATGWARSIIDGKVCVADGAILYERERATEYKAGTVLLYRQVTGKKVMIISRKCCFAITTNMI